MKIVRMTGPFGALAEDVDLASDRSEATLRILIDALHKHQILVIRGQALSDADYVHFGHQWGKPIDFMVKSHQREDHPEMIRISNAAATPERYRDGAVFWHADSTYEAVPAAVTMLYCKAAPKVGGETLIASSAFAYDALDDDTKVRIDGMTGLHCLGGSPAMPGEKIPFVPEDTARLGIQKHPLVVRHPVTERKALCVSGSIYGIEGMERDEGRAMIDRLRRHVVSAPFQTSYKAEPGDIFLWDNYQVLHSATPLEYSDEHDKYRLLYRISTKGVPALCEGVVAI